jgi:hypothetical protein
MIEEQKLLNFSADVLITAYEGGHCGMASWVISEDGLKWGSENGDYELGEKISYASATVYRLDEDSDEGYSIYPLEIDEKIIAEFVAKVGKGEFSQESIPEYGRMNTEVLSKLSGVYLGLLPPEDCDLDALDADSIVQMVLLGEVIYG